MNDRDELTGEIIAAAIDVHRSLGPGLLESTYEECMAFELTERGLLLNFNVPMMRQGVRRLLND